MPRILILAALVLCSLLVHGATLPDAPEPQRVWSVPQVAALGAVVLARAADWSSTEECIREPYDRCHEAILPHFIVSNKYGLAAFETSTVAISAFSQYELVKLHHRRLALISQWMQATTVGLVVMHNYRLCGRKMAPPPS